MNKRGQPPGGGGTSPPTARGSARSAAPRLSGRSGDLHFQAFHSGDSHFQAFGSAAGSVRSPAFSRSKRLKLVPEPPIFKLKTAQARSGDPHFHARPGAHSGDPHFHARPGARSGALAIFSLCRGTYLPKFGVSTPPPPPPPPPPPAIVRDNGWPPLIHCV